MANVKITELTALTNPASTDVLAIVDIAADTTKKVTIADLLENAGDGTATAPAFAFNSDTNTGIFLDAADKIGVSTNGVGRLYIDSSGNVGIGNSSPSSVLDVTGAAAVSGALTAGSAVVTGSLTQGGNNVVTVGDTGTVTSTMILDGTIVNADVSATAEIAVNKLANGTARQLLQTDAAGTGVEFASNIDVPGTLDVTSAATFDNNVTVQGNLTVNGTTTTIDSTTLVVEDKNIEMGAVTTPTDTTADGGGITLKGATDKTINWVNSTDAWTLSEHINIANAKEYRINGTKVLDATSLGSAVVGSSLTSVGTIGTGVWNGTPIATAYIADNAVTSNKIVDGAIVNADVNASAAIAGTKISPDFGSQNVLTTGNVGIGTSSPASLLHISSTVDTALKVQAASAVPTIELLRGNSTGFGTDATYDYRLKNEAGKLTIQNGVSSTISDLLTIDNLGNVGVGTTDPDYSLQVARGDAATVSVKCLNDNTQPVAGRLVYTFDDGDGASINGTRVSGETASGVDLSFRTGGITNAKERMRILSGGNVGIGVTNPGANLSVRNNDNAPGGSIQQWSADLGVNIRSCALLAPEIDDAATPFTFSTGNSWNFRVDTTDALTISSTGRVGIGTTSPGRTLHVSSSVQNPVRIQSSGTVSRIEFQDSNTGASDSVSIGSDGNDFQINTNTGAVTGTRRVTVKDDGNVGIGTNSPGAKLQVNSTAQTTFTNNPFVVKLQSTDAPATGLGSGISFGGRWSNTATQFADFGVISGIKENSTAGNFAGTLTFGTRANGAGVGSMEKMRISSNGNVGIGTTDPQTKLDVRGDALGSTAGDSVSLGRFSGATGVNLSQFSISNERMLDGGTWPTSSIRLQRIVDSSSMQYIDFTAVRGTLTSAQDIAFGQGNTEGMRITNGGNVGIGTNNPIRRLHVVDANNILRLESSSTTAARIEWQNTGSSSGDSVSLGSVNNDMQFVTSGSEKMRITSSGNVGIGTSSPATLLHLSSSNPQLRLTDTTTNVHFDINANSSAGNVALNVDNAATSSQSSFIVNTRNSERFRIVGTTGNVGIGTNAPDSKLTVNGTVAASNIYVGPDKKIGLNVNDGHGNASLIFNDISGIAQISGSCGRITATTDINNGSMQLKVGNNFVAGSTNGIATILTLTTSGASVAGSLSKSSGSFKIDHPLPALSETHDLVHSFVEAPDASNLYAGMVDLVDGTATVNIDTAHRMTEGTFEALNTLQSWSSSNESGYAPVKCSVSGNLLTIECQDATSADTVYYEVRGVRKDPHMLATEWTGSDGRVIVEPEKTVETEEDVESEE